MSTAIKTCSIPTLPSEIVALIAKELAQSGASKSTVVAMCASQAFRAIFGQYLRCSKLTLEATNIHRFLKGLGDSQLLKRSTGITRRSRRMGRRRPDPTTFRRSIIQGLDDMRSKARNQALKRHAATLSYATHLTIYDFKSAQAVVTASRKARRLGRAGLWFDVETVCLGPSLIWRLGYLDHAAVQVIDDLAIILQPTHLCFTFDIRESITDFHARAQCENGLAPSDHSLCSHLGYQWEVECLQSCSRVVEVLVGSWQVNSVSVHNLSVQRIPRIGPSSTRIFWAASSISALEEDHEFPDWQKAYENRAADVAQMIGGLSDNGEQVEFGGYACVGCSDRGRTSCLGEFQREVMSRVRPPQMVPALKKCVMFTAEPAVCEACGTTCGIGL